jgi:hypothetical protein
MGLGLTLPIEACASSHDDRYILTNNIKHQIMTFELEMALDILNGQIDKGVEFPEAIDRALKMYPVSQEELTAAYDNQ